MGSIATSSQNHEDPGDYNGEHDGEAEADEKEDDPAIVRELRGV